MIPAMPHMISYPNDEPFSSNFSNELPSKTVFEHEKFSANSLLSGVEDDAKKADNRRATTH